MRPIARARRAGTSACLAAICLSLLLAGTGLASGDADTQEGPIKAAFVYNFCKFVEWPESQSQELVLGLMGARKDTAHFESIAGKKARDLPIAVKQVEQQSDLGGCQLLFIAPDRIEQVPAILKQLEGRPVLTISDIEGFCEQGGMIQFVSIQGKMRFYINRKAAEQAQLSISSQLLKMAKIVEGDGQE